MRIKTSLGYKIATVLIYLMLTLFALVTVMPIMSIVSGSLTSLRENVLNPFILWPKEPNIDAYRYLLSTPTMPRAMGVTVLITVVGTIINILMTTIAAYPLAHANLIGRKYLMFFVTFTMIFTGGMIPTYLVVRATGLIGSLWSLMIPNAINTFNLILMKNFFQQIPISLEESAKLDGANDIVILFRIILPLSMASIATFTLFYALTHWNTFMTALLYLNDSKKWPLQILLRQIVILSQGGIGDEVDMGEGFQFPPQAVKMAAIVFATLPILFVYPFLQKYFVKGVMVGSVKG